MDTALKEQASHMRRVRCEVEIEDLVDAYRLVNQMFSSVWRAVHFESVPRSLTPRRSLGVSVLLHDVIVSALRNGQEAAIVTFYALSSELEDAEGEMLRMLDTLDSAADAYASPPVGSAAEHTLRRMFATASSDVTRASERLSFLQPTVGGIQVAATPVLLSIGVHDWVTVVLANIWQAMMQGRLSPMLLASDQEFGSFLGIMLGMAASVSDAVAAGRPDAAIRFALRSDELRSAAESLQQRLRIAPFAADFGVAVPDDPDVVDTIRVWIAGAASASDETEGLLA